jgi:hypothetical protein
MKIHLFIVIVFAILLLNPRNDYAQLKKSDKSLHLSDFLANQGNTFLSFMNPESFHMSHSISASYSALGNGNGIMLNSYINTIDMKLTDNLYLRTNIGIMSSPYNTLGTNFRLNKPQFFGGAEFRYKLTDNSSILLRVNYSPFQTYNNPGYQGKNFLLSGNR